MVKNKQMNKLYCKANVNRLNRKCEQKKAL